jgi:hypothetical protein
MDVNGQLQILAAFVLGKDKLGESSTCVDVVTKSKTP